MNKGLVFNLTTAFFPEDAEHALKTLERLMKHLPFLVLTGGVASSYYFWKYDFPISQRKLSDLDVVIEDPSNLRSIITQDFLVSHYHPKNHKGKFHIMLVDPKTKIRIDVFPFLSKANERVQTVNIRNVAFSILSLEDLVCRLLSNCAGLIENKEVDPKYFVTMLSLFGVSDRIVIRKIWEEYRKEGQNFDDTYCAILNQVKNKPELLKKIIYSQDLNHSCKECQPIAGIPLATNQQVFDLLRYV